MNPDAFRHLPALRERITPAQASELRVTPELLAAWDERARQLGRPADWRLSDQELDASHRAMLGGLGDGMDLWIYSYGSLMWDPGFHFDEVRLADLQGHRRRFLFRTTLGRGSPEQPGLMLSLEPGPGLCRGLVFRIPRRSPARRIGMRVAARDDPRQLPPGAVAGGHAAGRGAGAGVCRQPRTPRPCRRPAAARGGGDDCPCRGLAGHATGNTSSNWPCNCTAWASTTTT